MKKFSGILAPAAIIAAVLLTGCPNGQIEDGDSYSITVTIIGDGTLTVDPVKETYEEGETVLVTAVPDSGNSFFQWTGALTGYCDTTKTLTVSADMTIIAEFIPGSIHCVREGAAGGDGSFDAPWGTIQAAVDAASATARVLVSAGTYNESVMMKEGVSLYGGFYDDFSERLYQTEAERENETCKTVITSPSAIGEGTSDEPASAVIFDGTTTPVTTATIIEGFTVQGGIGLYDTAVLCMENSSPTIRHNTVSGKGDAANTARTHGIRIDNSAPEISRNIIRGSLAAVEQSYAVFCTNLTAGMKIDHNTIYGGDDIGGRSGAIGVYIYSAVTSDLQPVIEYNTITGGEDNNASSTGIQDSGCSSIIRYNTVHAGSARLNTWGIQCDNSMVYNNLINGGSGGKRAYGIYASYESSLIANNTIYSGSGTDNSYGINTFESESTIRNNIIFCEGIGNVYAVYATDTSGGLLSLMNNDLFDCDILLRFYDGTDTTEYTDLAAMESSGDFTASGNVSIDLIDNGGTAFFEDPDGADGDIATMDDNDWHLTTSTPVNVRGGGLNLSGTFTDDLDGAARTTSAPTGMTNSNAAGWSMGAYEED